MIGYFREAFGEYQQLLAQKQAAGQSPPSNTSH